MPFYGYIYGQPQSMYLSFYQDAPLTTYSIIPAFAVDLGQNTFGGQDMFVYSPTAGQTGDYQGKAVESISFDRN